MSPTVVVLVNWNGSSDSIACIQSLLAADTSVRIILCDNASSDGSLERIASWARGGIAVDVDPNSPVAIKTTRLPNGVALLDRAAAERGDDGDGAELLLVSTGGNLGFAGGNNVGLRWAMAAGAKHVWLLNNDTVVPQNSLAMLLKTAMTDPTIGLCGSTMVEYSDPGTLQGFGAAMDRRTFKSRHLGAGRPANELDAAISADSVRPSEVAYPIGASILVSAAFLKSVGLMDERYFLYYEEIDWVLRGLPEFRVAFARESIVFHKVGASAGSTPEGLSARSVAFLFRSRLLATRRFAPTSLPRVASNILVEAGKALVRGRTGKATGALRALSGRVRVPMAEKGQRR